MPKITDLPMRIASKIQVAENGCWIWIACRTDNGGYGKLSLNGKMWRAHRLVWTLLVGEIPPGLQMDHLCKNPPCVNPAHLEVVDQRTNTLRSSNPVADQARQTHCKRGHPLDLLNTRINRKGERCCRECGRMHARNYHNEVRRYRRTRKWREGRTQSHCDRCGQFTQWDGQGWACLKCRNAVATLRRYGLLPAAPVEDAP